MIKFPVGKHMTKDGREAEVFAVISGNRRFSNAENGPVAIGVIYSSDSYQKLMAWNATDGNRMRGDFDDSLTGLNGLDPKIKEAVRYLIQKL